MGLNLSCQKNNFKNLRFNLCGHRNIEAYGAMCIEALWRENGCH